MYDEIRWWVKVNIGIEVTKKGFILSGILLASILILIVTLANYKINKSANETNVEFELPIEKIY